MFGLGTWELALILVAALIFIGPNKLPDLARNLGKGMREMRRAMAGFEREVQEASRLDERAPDVGAEAKAAEGEKVAAADTAPSAGKPGPEGRVERASATGSATATTPGTGAAPDTGSKDA
jgi:sec-independent protein translocase protein TatB